MQNTHRFEDLLVTPFNYGKLSLFPHENEVQCPNSNAGAVLIKRITEMCPKDTMYVFFKNSLK